MPDVTLSGIGFTLAGVNNGERAILELTFSVGSGVVAAIDGVSGGSYTTSLTPTLARFYKTDGTLLTPPALVPVDVTFGPLQRVASITSRLVSAQVTNAAIDGALYLTAWAPIGAYIVEAPPPPPPTPGVPGGLLARYYNNLDLVGEPVYTATEVPYINIPRDSTPRPGVSDDFSAKFTGFLRVPTTGQWRFKFDADDHVRVYINGSLVVDKWGGGAGPVITSTIDLTSGVDYPFWIEFRDVGAGAVLVCQWQTSVGGIFDAFSDIPGSALYASLPDNLPVIDIPVQTRYYASSIARYAPA